MAYAHIRRPAEVRLSEVRVLVEDLNALGLNDNEIFSGSHVRVSGFENHAIPTDESLSKLRELLLNRLDEMEDTVRYFRERDKE